MLINIRVDVHGSATQDLKPYFPFLPRENQSNPSEIPPPQTKALLIANELISAFPMGEQIFNIFSETAVFTEELKLELSKRSKKVYEDGAWSWNHLYPLTHTLSSCHEAVDLNVAGSVLMECCRLALCIYLTPIRAKFGASPAEVLEVFVDQLLPLVQNVGFTADYGKEQSNFRMWVLVMGAMECSGEATAVFVDILKRELRVLAIETHVDLEEALMDIMWIGEISGERFWKLYGELWMEEEDPISVQPATRV